MRTYAQFCAVARALDVVGDRWNLLIVRELLLRGPSRYSDLREGLPGIATNLLAERLAALEVGGVVNREAPKPPLATHVYSLTPRGVALSPVLRSLGAWGAPLLRDQGRDVVRAHWLALPAAELLRDREPAARPILLRLRCGGEDLYLEVTGDGARATEAPDAQPDAAIEASGEVLVGILTGRLDPDEARAQGALISGDPQALARVLPA